MKLSQWILSFLLLSSVYSFAQVNQNEYIRTICNERKQKNKEFRSPEESPLTEEDQKNFKGLNYYPPDITYIVEAKLTKEPSPDTIKMKTTTERLPLYLVYGKVQFTLHGKEHTLTIFQNIGLMKKPGYEDYLFIPFIDDTNGEDTYGGGRFIDLRKTDGDSLTIDFNKAYNPYCEYNHKFSCPIPPKENYINAKVMAGEKKY
ncbi:MAG: DUF1684 domain-containing protein [Lentimicrobiaceae bacterium]